MLVPWRLPIPYTREATRRAWLLLDAAEEPLLDLGGAVSPVGSAEWVASRPEARVLSAAPDPTRAIEKLVAEGANGTFATVSSVIVTPYVADLHRFLRAVAGLLDDDGLFLFVEPDSPATTGVRVARSFVRPLSGLEVGRDTTGAMWDSGLSVARIERKPVRRAAWPFRSLVSGVARLAPRD